MHYPMSNIQCHINCTIIIIGDFVHLHLCYFINIIERGIKKKPITCLKLMFRPEHLMFCFSGTTTSGQMLHQ